MTTKTYKAISYSLLAINLVLSIIIWQIDPDKVGVVPAGGLVLPAIFVFLMLFRKNGARACKDERAMGTIYEHLMLAALMVCTGLLVTLTNIAGITQGDMGNRLFGAMLGMMIVFFGNRLPRQVPSKGTSESIARQQTLQRFTGYTMVISGMLMITTWIVLPERIANTIFIGIGILMTLIIFGRCFGPGRKGAHA